MTESLVKVMEELEEKGVALLKKEYVNRTQWKSADFQPDSQTFSQPDVESKSPPVKKIKLKGQNKNRAKFYTQRPDPKRRLCPAILCENTCLYGDKCKFSHDVVEYMNNKKPDIADNCYNFDTFGKCSHSFSCRFGSSHIKLIDGVYANISKNVAELSGSKECNSLSKELQHKLRKNSIDYSKAKQATKEAQSLVQRIVQKNVELHCTAKPKCAKTKNSLGEDNSCNQSASFVEDTSTHEALEIYESSNLTNTLQSNMNCDTFKTEKMLDNREKITSKECSQVVSEKVGPITNEDQFLIKPGEKKTIDFKNKLYLAPLTTVGNLPFRRVCKSLGADITCGEMALATKLLQGVGSEWALLKRHSSEDLFGVQLCGAFADTMSKCAQLVSENCSVDFIDINVGCPIDMIFDMGAGSALMRRVNRFQEIVRSMDAVTNVPITAKIRTGINDSKNTAHTLIPKLREWGIQLTTLHGRSREQRYTKLADWSYIGECSSIADPMTFFGGGDILSYEDYNACMTSRVSGTMIARGALIKPWLFTEIKEQKHWDISANERLDILKDYVNYGLEHWGSDDQGVETVRRFLLEWLSFLHRYIPIGLLERVPQKINERPSPYFGRNDLETLMASPRSADWIKISEMLLGPIPDGFFFIPKHKASSYS